LTWGTLPSPTLFNIRLKDGLGNWGPVFKKTIFPNGANPTPNLIQQGSTLTVCPNASVTLTYSGPNGYTPTWFNATSGNSVTFNVTSPGYYGVTATLGAATYQDSIYIAFHNVTIPTVTPTGTVVACASNNTILSASTIANATYQWYYNGTVIPGATGTTYIPSMLGSYYVSVTTSANGCTGFSDTTTLTTTASITPSGTVTTCQPSLVLNAPVGTGATYQWLSSGSPISGATGATYTVTQNGSYSVTVTNGSCTATAPSVSVTLGTGSTPTITASGPTTFCTGGSVTLTSSSATGNLWSNGATTQSITVTQSGTYSVTVTSGQCSGTSTATNVVVTAQPAAPTITASGPTTFCAGGSVTLTSSSATGNLWSNGATTQSITVNTAGSYSVTVSSGNCTATSSNTTVTVTSVPTPTITGPDNVVAYTTHTYAVSQTPNHTYQWTVTGGAVMTGQGSNVISVLWGNSASGTIRVVENNGSCTEDDTLSVDVSGIGLDDGSVNHIKVHPNPGSGNFELSIPEDRTGSAFGVFDMTGRMVAQGWAVAPTTAIDLSHLASGIYQLQLMDGRPSGAVRIIVQR